MTLAPGTCLGPYEIVALIGAGGMGRVYRAHDTRLGRDVALKVADERFSDRFSREARTVAALNHPNICTLYDVGPNYLVMELIEGPTLADRVEQAPLTAGEVVAIARQVAAALEEAHRRGVLHRDLKPGNIMLAERRDAADRATVKVLDFGLAKVAQGDPDATRTVVGTVMGTPAYMAPEQVEGQVLDERSEVFSFGAVLYEMLTRRRPFEGVSLVDVLNAVVRSDPAPSKAPPALDRIVRRCLQKEPAKRYQSMAEIRAALEPLRDSVSPKPISTQPSIAVLPFADMSAGKDHEWFSDGLSEEIINALVHIPGLTVIARTSAFAFKGKQEDIRRIGDVLGVTHVLEGSVRRAGDRVRISAQLIAADSGAHLWSERYDRDMADVFAIQDEIGHAIASTLKTKLAARRARPRRSAPTLVIASTVETRRASQPPTARRYTPALPAYEAYLKARYHWAQATPEALFRSKHYYEQAIAIDPEFAAAYVGLADHLVLQAAGMGITPAREAMPAARAAAERALAIDPSLSDAHAVLGAVACSYDYDWIAADRRFQVALAHEPVPALARVRYGFFYLGSIGQPDAAVTQLQLALQDDPLNTMFLVASAGCLLMAGRIDEATDACLKVVSHENNWQASALLVSTSLLKGRPVDAATFAEKAYSPSIPVTIGLLAGSLARSGDEARADALMEPLIRAPERYGAPRGLAAFHSVRGDLDRVADWLEKSIEQRDAMAPHFARRWCRNSSRWPELAKMMNLPS
jgi:serine/threonine protein kinase